MSVVALELKTISGIPLHPLIVHIPVVLIPLAFFGAIAALVRPSWRHWALPLTALFTLGSLAGVQFAMMSGEGLEEINGEHSALIERHSSLAEQTRPFVFVFFLLAAAAAVAHYLASREEAGQATSSRAQTLSKMLVPLCALSVVLGGLSTVWVYRTGHSGAQSVWKGEGGGDKKDGDKKDKEGGEKSGDENTRPDGDTDGD